MTDTLIEKLEQAEEGSRELECLIAKQLGWFRYTRELGCTMKRGGWIAPEDFRGTDSAGRPILDSLHGTSIQRDPPRFTRSLDDCLRYVVPEGCESLLLQIWPKRRSVNAVVGEGFQSINKRDPALALTIAALKARAEG